MASLSNINGLFDVHSTGAILFSTSHGTSGQILRSNGNAAPTWVAASTVIGGPYLPLTGGTLSGPLVGTSANFSSIVYSSGGFRTGSTNSSYNLLTRDNNNGSYPLYCQNSLGVSGDAAIARFAYGSYGANTGTVILDIRSGTSYFNDCNLGIGTASPGSKLTVSGPATPSLANGENSIRIESHASAAASPGELGNGINFAQKWWSGSAGLQVTGGIYGIKNAGNGTYGGGLAFYTQPSSAADMAQRMVIDTDGNVGIGTTSPNARLHVDHPANPTSIRIGNNTTDDCWVMFNTDGNDWSIGADRSDSNKFKISDYSTLGTNDRLVIDTSGNVGIGTTSPNAKLEVNGDILLTYLKATGNCVIGGSNLNSSRLSVQDSKNGSASSPHFQILGNGYSAYHYLNTTAYNIVTNSTAREIRVIAQNGGVKLAYAATAWAANSDIALKENIKPLENVLDKIKDYRCVEYNLKESPEDKKIGFIAQDWVNDFPVIVNKDEKDMLGMKYTETIPVLLKAIQELTARIKELENK